MRVLQIEDDVLTAKAVETILKSDGHECDTAHFGEDALAMAVKHEYDIILLDLGLPDMDGIEVLRRLRAAQVLTPVIIQSGLVMRKIEVKDPGVKDYLAKPFDRIELIESLRAVAPGTSALGDRAEEIGTKADIDTHTT